MAIYKVSFPNPNPAPGEDPYDTVDTNELKNCKLNDETIRTFDNDRTIHVIKYEFCRANVMPENKEKIYIRATCDSIDAELKPDENLDIPTFVDEVAKGAYQRKTPDSSTYIIEAKTKLKSVFASKLLEQGTLAINNRYNSFGYIYAGADVIGTFENITIDSENEFTMIDSQSIVDLENATDVSVQLFIEKKESFSIEIESMKNKNTAIISSIKPMKDIPVPKEVMELKSKDEYQSEEDFFAARRSMINTNLVEDNFSLEDIDLFD